MSDPAAPSRPVASVGVIGAGVMGAGVAQELAQSGFFVVLVDRAEDALRRARQEIRQGSRFLHLLRKDRPPQDPEQVLGRIGFVTDLQRVGDVDFVIENVTELWAVKAPVYAELDAVCPPHCIFAANTSAIPIRQIAGATRRPAQVLGLHFMNPPSMKDTVEVVRAPGTSDHTLALARLVLERMGKRAIVVNDSPGFVSNRVLMLTINEAIALVQEGVASVEDIDEIFRACFGHKMGPLETADLIGLDTILLSLDVLQEQFDNPKFRPCPLLREMVRAGHHGRKAGRGFYRHAGGPPADDTRGNQPDA